MECANAISFMVNNNIVYKINEYEESQKKKEDAEDDPKLQEIIKEISESKVEHTLDAIMNLSGSDSRFIRTTAFSTLSSLSTFSSQYKSVKAQI